MSENTKTIVEINGVKMEVDTRYARRIDTVQVGTKVKILVKASGYSGNSTDVYSGVVVGFEPFGSLPTIIVCYLIVEYQEVKLKFAYVNASSADKYEMVVSVDDELPVKKADVLAKLDREIEKKREEIADLELKRDYFLRHFEAYFQATA